LQSVSININNISLTHDAQLQTIGNHAFSNNSNLTNINIPPSVTHIGQGAFFGSSKLTNPYFENNTQINAFNTYWAISNNSTWGSATPKANETHNGTLISNIIRCSQSTYYNHHTATFHSLVNPALLTNAGQITLTYFIRKETTGTPIRGLQFRYSDGTTSPVPTLADNTNWQHFTLISDFNKTVVALELGYSHDSYVRIGNIQLNGKANLWDTNWLLLNQHGAYNVPPAFSAPNDYVNKVSDIVQINAMNFYCPNLNAYSLIDPAMLPQTNGEALTLAYSVRRLNPTNPIVTGLCFRYGDGTTSTFHFLAATSNWQTFTASSIAGKTVTAIELIWWFDEWLQIGNVFVG
jgi:hypothetical protein